MTQLEDERIKTVSELKRLWDKQGIPKISPVIFIDFSLSMTWNKNAHDIQNIEDNTVIKTIRALNASMSRFLAPGKIPAYRFGCKDSEDFTCVPLDLEHQQSPYFDNFQQVE